LKKSAPGCVREPIKRGAKTTKNYFKKASQCLKKSGAGGQANSIKANQTGKKENLGLAGSQMMVRIGWLASKEKKSVL
jgi:hypothetical protein